MAHLDGDIDVAEQGAGAARRLPHRPIALGWGVQHQDRDPLLGEPAEWQQSFQDALGVVLMAQQGSQGIENGQVDAVLLMKGVDPDQQLAPTFGIRDTAEGGEEPRGDYSGCHAHGLAWAWWE